MPILTGLIWLVGLIGLWMSAVVLSALSRRLVDAATRGRPGAERATRLAAATPKVFAALLLAGLVAQNVWSDVRGLDHGAFDVFRTPLGHGYFATSFDSWSPEGVLEGPGTTEGGPLGRRGVRRSGCAGNRVVLDLLGDGPRYGLITGGLPPLREAATEGELRRLAGPDVLWSADRVPPAACDPYLQPVERAVRGALFPWGPTAVLGGLMLAVVWRVSQVRRSR